jgi:hypothetical protein
MKIKANTKLQNIEILAEPADAEIIFDLLNKWIGGHEITTRDTIAEQFAVRVVQPRCGSGIIVATEGAIITA